METQGNHSDQPGMQPLPETAQAVDTLDAFAADLDLLDQLVTTSGRIRGIVPQCVGLSVTMIEHGVTFTLVASDLTTASLDAVQYLDDGPCLEALDDDVIGADADVMDERGWHLFAEATSAAGVASTFTLSLPMISGGDVVGGFNLYGSSPTCFEGREQALADLLGAWGPGAVRNADLAFDTRETARRAPGILREQIQIDVAVGLVAGRLQLTVEQAQERFDRAAQQAGLSHASLADAVQRLLTEKTG